MKFILFVLLFVNGAILYAPDLTKEQIYQRQVIENQIAKKEMFLKSLSTLPFTKENFLQAMIYLNLKHPKILFKQAIIESANFTSNFWVNYNNPYGMHYPKSRKTTASSYVSGDPHKGNLYRLSVYNHWSDAIIDMKYFQDYWISKGWKIDEVEDYFIFLKDLPYAIAGHYRNTVNAIKIINYM